MSAIASLRVTSAVNLWLVKGRMVPCSFMLGGKSFETNRSEPPDLLIAVNNFVIWALACASVKFDIWLLADRVMTRIV
jgi:hypothetical protein